ncbi:hypothetical protein Btru_014257 [Bulinus truncatus]|nr:hypothetical protein Btru_014257 [Bulinus truncatus]
MFNKKVPTILVGINEKNWFPEKVLTSCEHMFSANSLKPDAPDNLANAYSKTITFPKQSLLLSKIDDDSHQKQSWAPLDLTFPLAKFNLDYEKISGTTERFLKTINLNDSSEKSGNEDLTGNVCSQCASPDVLEETEIILKELRPAETFSLEAKKISTSPDIFVNNIHTLSSSDMATTDNLFSEDLTIYKRKAVTILPGDFINKDVNEDQSFTANYQLACNETTEHVVPDINHSQIYGVTESSMFEEECLHLKELDAKSRTVFCWTSDSLNIPVSDQLSYPAVQQCSRSLRLGLSKKQKVKHLHKK